MSTFHIGLPEKNASAKPYRGPTHNNIFGTPEPVEPQPTPKKNASNSSMKNLLMEETDSTKEKDTNGVHDKKSSNENITPNENANNANLEPPKRVRMPPGGFSSGLW